MDFFLFNFKWIHAPSSKLFFIRRHFELSNWGTACLPPSLNLCSISLEIQTWNLKKKMLAFQTVGLSLWRHLQINLLFWKIDYYRFIITIVVKIFIYSRIKKNVKRRGFDSLDLNFICCCLVFQDVRIVLFVLLQEIKQIKNVNVGNNWSVSQVISCSPR